MEGPRAPSVNEYSDIVSFLNENLKAERTWSVAEEYPTVFNLQNLHNLRIIKDDSSAQILSHAVIKPTMIKTRRGLFKVGCIGSVVTSEKYRHQGLSTNVINNCLSDIQAQNCDFALLWSNLFDFYAKMGFTLAGSEISFLIEKPFALPKNLQSQPLTIMQENRVDPQALFRIYGQHTVTSVRTLEDFQKFLKIPNSRLYTAWSSTGRLEAYAVEGKGADLQGYIHEWGGSLQGVLALLSHIRLSQVRPITFITPAHSIGIIRELNQLGIKKVDGYLGLIKIVNHDSLFAKVKKNLRIEWGVEDFILEKRPDAFYYGIGDDLYKTDSEADIVKLLFGPNKPSKLAQHSSAIAEVLDKVFPMEMWIWGWDSI